MVAKASKVSQTQIQKQPDSEVEPVVEIKTLAANRLAPGMYSFTLDKIVKGDNIRDAARVKKVDDIKDSIEVNGLKVPVTCNCDMVLLDGYRRLHVLETLYPKLDAEIPVLIIDVPHNEISFYQYQTMQRTGISQKEGSYAITRYKTQNPYMNDKAIALKFGIDPKTVTKALTLYNASPELNDLVLSNKVSQNAALQVIEQVVGGDKPTTTVAKKKIQNKLATVVECLKNELKEADPDKLAKPLNLNKINSILTAREESPILPPAKEKESKQIPAKKQAIDILKKLFSSATFSPDGSENGSDFMLMGGRISSEFFTEISQFLNTYQEVAPGTINWRYEREIEDELEYYEKNIEEGELFIQDETSHYKTFNTELVQDFPNLELITTVENSLEFIRMDRDTLEKLLKKLTLKNISATVVRQLKYTNRPSSKIETEELASATKNTLLQGIESNEQSQSVVSGNLSNIEDDSSAVVASTITELSDDETTLIDNLGSSNRSSEMSAEEIAARNDIFGHTQTQNIPVISSVPGTAHTKTTLLVPDTDTTPAKSTTAKKKFKGQPNFAALAQTDKDIIDYTAEEEEEEEEDTDIPF